MEEQIIKKLDKLDSFLYVGVNEDLHIGGKGKEEVAKEIASHFVEFDQWKLSFCDIILEEGKYCWVTVDCDNILNSEEVYLYWLENIKNK